MNDDRLQRMDEIRGYVIMVMGGVFTLLAPIQNFMYAMVALFGLNFMFGLLAARVQGEKWSTKKALWFFGHSAIFFLTVCALFIIGHLMGETKEATSVVKIMCYMAIYIFSVNILRNWKKIVPFGSVWHRLVDLLYYVLSVKFVERFDFVRKWQEEREKLIEEEYNQKKK